MNPLFTLIFTFGILQGLTASLSANDQKLIPSVTRPVILQAGLGQIPLGKHLEILEDPSGQIKEPPMGKAFENRWFPNEAVTPNWGFTDSVYWVRFTVNNPSLLHQDFLLEIGYPHLDHIEWYVPLQDHSLAPHNEQPGSDARWHVLKMGDAYPFHQRPIAHRNFVIRLPSPLPREQTLYLRFQTGSSMQFPLKLWDAVAFAEEGIRQDYGLGIYFGIMLVMILYNSFIFFGIRDKSYLYYVSYLISFSLFQLSINGLAYEYLWSSFPWWANRSIPFFMGCAGFSAVLFSRSYLQTQEYQPLMDRFLQITIILSGFLIASSLLLDYYVSIHFGIGTAILVALLLFSAGVLSLKSGYHAARYYMLAWTFLLLGSLIYALKSLGSLPANVITEYAMQIGSALEVILLSLGLADRINQERNEKEKAQKETIQVQKESTETLESRILERTEELRKEHERYKHSQNRLAQIGQMTSSIVHDFKNPVGAIQGFAELLKMGLVQEGDQERTFEKIHDESTRVLDMAYEILDFAKGDVLLELQEIRLPYFLKEMKRYVSNYCDAKITIELDEGYHGNLTFDFSKMRQVIYNLGTNGRDAMPEGGILTLGSRESSEGVELYVKDTGFGIPESIQANLFEMFVTHGKPKGSGIGTHIAKTIVEAHGGTIRFETKKGAGTTFIITLPRQKQEVE